MNRHYEIWFFDMDGDLSRPRVRHAPDLETASNVAQAFLEPRPPGRAACLLIEYTDGVITAMKVPAYAKPRDELFAAMMVVYANLQAGSPPSGKPPSSKPPSSTRRPKKRAGKKAASFKPGGVYATKATGGTRTVREPAKKKRPAKRPTSVGSLLGAIRERPEPKIKAQRFNPGQLLSTTAVQRAVPREVIVRALKRFATGDWGEVTPRQAKSNNRATQRPGVDMILGIYQAPDGTVFWIKTEYDWSVTTVYLPEEN